MQENINKNFRVRKTKLSSAASKYQMKHTVTGHQKALKPAQWSRDSLSVLTHAIFTGSLPLQILYYLLELETVRFPLLQYVFMK